METHRKFCSLLAFGLAFYWWITASIETSDATQLPPIQLMKSGACVMGGPGGPDTLSCDKRTNMDLLLGELPNLRELRHVIMTDAPAKDDHLKIIAAFPDLISLQLIGSKITDEGTKSLAGQKTLEGLVLDETQIGDACSRRFANCKALRIYQ